MTSRIFERKRRIKVAEQYGGGGGGGGSAEVNNLSDIVTWADIPIGNVPTGNSANSVALGNHAHTGIYEPADATILKDADIGVNVQAYMALVSADVVKLDGIETSADVTDTANVTAAGALMDSEVDADLKTLVVPSSTTISAFGATLVDDANAGAARTTLDVDQSGTDNSVAVTLAGTPNYITLSGQEITRTQIDLTADITGNLPVGSLNGGTGASSATFWRGDATWAEPPAGAGGGIEIYHARGTNTASLNDLSADLTWDVPIVSSLTLSVSASTGVVALTSGNYLFDVSLRTSNANRTELFVRTWIDTGGGYAASPADQMSNYVSRDTDQNTGGLSLNTTIPLSVGHKVKFSGFGDTDGTCTMLADGTNLRVVK